jgi:predicted acylesterase/phospholipase RssA
MLRFAAFAVTALFASMLCAAPPDYTLPIRIGVVAFDKYDKEKGVETLETQRKALNALGDDQPVARYLRALAKESALVPTPRFQIYRGNYYQVMAWIENGDIDGAVLSPFMAMRASEVPRPERVGSANGLPSDRPDTKIIATFAYNDEGAQKGWTRPYIAASRGGRELAGPNGRYQTFIRQLVMLHESGEGHDKTKKTKELPYAVSLVSHLSTSGFIVPLIYTHKLLHDALEKLDPKVDRAEVATQFWDLYFRYVRLTFWHQKIEDDDDKTVFTFTYENSSSLRKLKYAAPYMWDAEGIDPNDVLVLRARAGTAAYKTIKSLQDATDAQKKAAAENAMKTIKDDSDALKTAHEAASPTAEFEPPHWYRRIGLYDDRVQEKFESYAHGLFLPQPRASDVCSKAMHERWSKWYEGGQYDFSAKEIIALLSHDQLIRDVEFWRPDDLDPARQPAGALVLPGGGVRGTYQAALLDKLYDAEKLINYGEATKRRLAPQDGKLILRHVIGTSGGALVGFFAAQRSSGTGRGAGRLREEWIKDDGKVVATPQRIFPPVGLLRWISALVILALYAMVARMTFGRQESAELPEGRLSPIIVFGIGLAVVLAPFVLWRLARTDGTYTPSFEGSFYCALVLIGHSILTFTTCPKKHQTGKLVQNVVATFIAIAALVVLGLIFFLPRRVPGLAQQRAAIGHLEVSGESLVAFAALLAILLAVVIYAKTHDLILPAAVKAYGWGVGAAAALLGLALAFFKLGTYMEATSTIEMTVEYWIWIGAAAIAAGAILTGIGKLTEGTRIANAVTFWNDEHPKRRFLATPGESLVLFGVVALVLWTVFAAPALYNSSQGFDTFRRSAERWRDDKHEFLTNFVATMSSLGTAQVAPEGSPEYRGDFYVCREEQACTVLHNTHPDRAFEYKVNDAKDEDFLNAVFASGSPFPIYPSRLLKIPDAYSGMFMDGGYTHNTPIEAAHLLNAQQVLIVHSAQRVDPTHGVPAGRTVSALAGDSATLFSFLFDRSQALDQAVRANMFVASLAPYAGRGPDAFLMDFRQSTVTELRNAADDDFDNRRIGQVDSWGLPTRLLHDTAIEWRQP